ncbi:MAG: HAMP domain-containing sensor histidine kinase [Pseudomonadota bacterium]
MKYIRAFLSSMRGRLFMLLLGGMAAAALVASLVSNFYSGKDFEQQVDERTADRLQQFIWFMDAIPPDVRARVLQAGGFGVFSYPAATRGIESDPDFSRLLATRKGTLAAARAEKASLDLCYPELRNLPKPDMVERMRKMRGIMIASGSSFVPPDCRLVSVNLSDGTPLHLSLDTPWVQRVRGRMFDPAFMVLFGLGIVVLAYFAALFASAPLRRLAQASTELGHDLNRQPLTLKGPSEVRQAAAAFNSMQARLQMHFAERTQMLAAITHDLQTPLTRLRLRLERVDNEELRERLIADLRAMQELIGEGLELARVVDGTEPAALVDVDSLLESLVEDAIEAGSDARFAGGCGAVLPLRLLSTRRVFGNLLDNALKHGGSAVVRAERDERSVRVFVRDHGPGLPEFLLERAFEPFFRAEHSRSRETGGTGLGLTIARTLAQAIGATLELRNHPEGGLEAQVTWPVAGEASDPGAQ